MKIRWILGVAATIGWVSRASADISWEAMQGPFGGDIQSVVVTPDHVFVSSFEGGVFRSGDGGVHWARVWFDPGPRAIQLVGDRNQKLYLGTTSGLLISNDSGVSWVWTALVGSVTPSIEVDSSGHIFAVEGAVGLVRSTDGGANWVGLAPFDGFPFAIAIDSKDRLFAGTNLGVVYRSTNGGDGWTSLGSPWPVLATCSALAVGPGDAMYAGSLGAGVYRSTDAGATWMAAGLINTVIDAFAFDADGRVFVGTGGGGLYRSASGAGGDWEHADVGAVVEAVATGVAGQVFAGGNRGVFRSVDHGDHWLQSNEGLTAVQFQSFLFDARGRLFGTSFISGVFRGEGGGQSWQYAGLGSENPLCLAEEPSGLLLAGTGFGLMASPDGGNSWNAFGLRYAPVTALSVDPSGSLLAGTPRGVLISNDHGGNWRASNEGLGDAYIFDFARHPGGSLLAATDTGVFATADRAAHWSKQGLDGLQVRKLAVDSRGRIYASSNVGLFRTDDLGVHWVPVADPNAEGSYQVVIDAFDEVWVATRAGVYRSVDGGDHWIAENSGLSGEAIVVLGIDPSGYIYAQGFAGPVYRSPLPSTPVTISDFTAESAQDGVLLRWRTARSNEIARFRVFRCAISRENDAGTGGTFEALGPDVTANRTEYSFRDAQPLPGLSRYRLTALAADGGAVAMREVDMDGSAVARRSHLAGNFPNPFNPSTVLRFGIGASGPATIDVVDARGRVLRTLWGAARATPGNYAIEWDGRDARGKAVASGVYWARLTLSGCTGDARSMTLLR